MIWTPKVEITNMKVSVKKLNSGVISVSEWGRKIDENRNNNSTWLKANFWCDKFSTYVDKKGLYWKGTQIHNGKGVLNSKNFDDEVYVLSS